VSLTQRVTVRLDRPLWRPSWAVDLSCRPRRDAPADRAEYGELLAGVLGAAAEHDAARAAETHTWQIPRQP